LALPLSTVVHVQRRLGLARVLRPAPPPVVQYERERPGHRVNWNRRRASRGSGWEYLHVAIDDCSRVSYATFLPDETGASCAAFLHPARAWFTRQGITIAEILTDNGPVYRHRFAAYVARCAITHRFTRAYRPQTNGRAERFIRTCLQEWAYARTYRSSRARASALSDFLRYWFHMGIGGLTPMQRLAARQ